MNLLRCLLFLLIVPPFLGGCHRLQVRSEPIFPSYLASERVDTPDLRRLCYYGEQIVVHWTLPRTDFKESYLRIQIRYGDRTVESYESPITCFRGYWTLRLVNEEFWTKRGFLAYKVELFEGDVLKECWQHQIWADIIEINPS